MSSPRNPGPAAKRVLVIKLSALGDFVLAMGAMKAIRAYHADAEITLLTTPPFERFAKPTGYFNRIETDGRPEGVSATRALLKRIRRADYDIIYDLQTSGRTANYFKALNLPFRTPPLWSGHAKRAAFRHDGPERDGMHSIDRLGEQLEIAGVPRDVTPEWPPMPDLSFVQEKFGHLPDHRPERYGFKGANALLIPGASAHRDAKRWPIERYVELAGMLSDAGVEPVLIGGKSEYRIASQITAAEPRVKNLTGQTNLFQIVTLAKHALFAVGNDTGPMHMAALAGCPSIALFATDESDPVKAAPRGGQVIVCTAPVLGELSVGDVWQAVRALGRLP